MRRRGDRSGSRAGAAILLLVVAFFGGAACEAAGGGAPFERLVSDEARLTAPVVPSADAAALADGNLAFALDLYELLCQEPGNLVYSPHSVSIALAMAWAGARGDTAAELAAALHFTLPQERLHAAFDAVDLALASRGEDATDEERPFRLRVVDALWGLPDYPFLPAFLDVLAVNYGAGMNLLDFLGDPEGSRATINGWVADQTRDRIRDLLPPGSITSLTRLVLTNAIYFDAAWAEPFPRESTKDADFTLLDGATVTAPRMNRTATFRYAEGADWQAVELPYDGGQVAMIVLLPAAGAFAAVEGRLGPGLVAELRDGLAERDVHVGLPRFSFASPLGLAAPLRTLGMEAAFDEAAADFTGMAETGELYVSDVVHQAFVAVDEEGTEAAAATAVIMAGRGMPSDPVEIVADRPFLFWIEDSPTGALLFVGRTVDPR